MNPQKLAELISLGLTVPTITLASIVVYLFGYRAWHATFHASKTAVDWFILGVATGFLGAALDNFYWFIPWTASYLGSDWESPLMQTGVFFNIFFRQTLGIIAGYCHIQAAVLFNETRPVQKHIIYQLMIVSVIAGFAFAYSLYLFEAM